jgi:hypothetical protein
VSAGAEAPKAIRSTIPARLDRLSWSPFHTRCALIGTGEDRTGLFVGYVVGGAIMILGGIVELLIGIKAEGKSLEDVTEPITSVSAEAAAAGA